jgi:hypothetical protein
MLRRIFWLVLIGVAGWVAWMWLRRRQGDFAHPAPQFAPPRPFERPTSPAFAPPHTPGTTAAPPTHAGRDESLGAAPSDQQVAPEAPAEAREQVAKRVPGAAEGGAPLEDSAAAEAAPPPAQDTSHAATPASVPTPAISTASENERATIEASSAGAPTDAQPLEQEVAGYCVRCKTKRTIQDAHEETTETGRRAARGVCPVCGANMFTFLKDDEDDQEAEAAGA